MTAAEAIKIQEKRLASPFIKAHTDTAEATRLGIEALKRVKNARDIGQSVPATLLPGETRESVFICPEDCQFFLGEDGCGSTHIDNSFVYEKEGDYPYCPFYMKPLLAKPGQGR